MVNITKKIADTASLVFTGGAKDVEEINRPSDRKLNDIKKLNELISKSEARQAEINERIAGLRAQRVTELTSQIDGDIADDKSSPIRAQIIETQSDLTDIEAVLSQALKNKIAAVREYHLMAAADDDAESKRLWESVHDVNKRIEELKAKQEAEMGELTSIKSDLGYKIDCLRDSARNHKKYDGRTFITVGSIEELINKAKLLGIQPDDTERVVKMLRREEDAYRSERPDRRIGDNAFEEYQAEITIDFDPAGHITNTDYKPKTQRVIRAI